MGREGPPTLPFFWRRRSTVKYKFSNLLVILLASVTASSQVASHAPTVFKQPPTQEKGMVALSAVGKPVARVNGAVLTDTDLVREEYAIFPYARQHSGVPKELEPGIRDGALKMIIFEELVYQEAVRRKMTVSPARMQRAEADFRKQFSNSAEFNALLQSEFRGSQQMLREKIRRSLLIEGLLKAEIDDKSVVTPAELKAYYDKNQARFRIVESYTFQTISILPPAKATADQLKEGRKRAEDALRQAKLTKNAEEFGMLAEKISDDDYRVMMGQHKPVIVEQLAPQVLKVLTAMKANDVSDVIQIDQAYTILHLNVHTPAGVQKFADVKVHLAKDLQQSKGNQLRSTLDSRLRKNAKIEEL